ncbi:hypothetical protein WSS15_28350 [Acetobacter pasteurianus]|uniref:Uncharacterized protein n=1 Tax=Acetobacter pasteurianus NBRC 3278 TaxID=1226660 RepID=A0A401X7D5_ACEPA|nr:hypothetical protein NBRC3277_2670 [Acetobacter pasteurianus NBRC 3277]GCD63578.1 hypothetical protein NBRC3278_2671 [Acetobacter pasteurianus NBRC 3278]GCD69946.1 hypothetical protein NBRC3280_2581 [Acetobacter pasteurianus NBRC 3280]GLH30185.1 hypothetical protein WSS15_28350 [Acetobacter pasteurianus]
MCEESHKPHTISTHVQRNDLYGDRPCDQKKAGSTEDDILFSMFLGLLVLQQLKATLNLTHSRSQEFREGRELGARLTWHRLMI